MIAPKDRRPDNERVRNAAKAAVAEMMGKQPSRVVPTRLGQEPKDLTGIGDLSPTQADAGPAAHRVDTTRLRDSSAASARQVEANRANAQKSTGPRTDAGKARSSRNALRHGLFSKAAVLPGEDAQEYAKLSLHLFMIYAPAPDEEDLVARLVRQEWMLKRVQAAEAEVGKTLAEQGKTAARALAEDYMGIGNSGLLRMMNHEMRIGNSILSIKRRLAKLQENRPPTGYDGEDIGDLTQYSEASLRELLGGSNAALDGSNPIGADDAAACGNEADLGAESSAGMQNEPEMPGSAPPEARVA